MKDLTKIYIDVSKCTEEQQKHIISLLPEPILSDDYDIRGKYKYLLITDDYDNYCDKWYVDFCYDDRTELTYPEFIKLFEGGEKYDGWIKIESEADLPKETGFYYAYNKVGKRVDIDYMDWDYDEHSERWMEFNSHYQPIILPEPPKF